MEGRYEALQSRPPYNRRCAAAWRALVPLFRNYQQQISFRLYESHPHNYDCLAVRDQFGGREVRFHLSDGSIQAWPSELLSNFEGTTYITPNGSRQEGISVAHFVARGAQYGDPRDCGYRVHALLCMEVIAEAMQHYAAGDNALEARSGFFEGEDGGFTRDWTWNVPWAANKLRDVPENDLRRQAEIGRRVWRLNTALVHEADERRFGLHVDLPHTAILNFSTGELILSDKGPAPIPIGAMFLEGKLSVADIVEIVLDALGSVRHSRTPFCR